MTSTKNTTLYIDENCRLSVLRDAPIPEPAEGELLIETSFSGINPADVKHAEFLGIRPAVMGYDFCGKVVRAPPNSGFSKGDIVGGFTPTGLGRPLKYGAHQTYLACPQEIAFRVPDSLPESHAATLAVTVCVAADILYNIFHLSLPDEMGETKEGSTSHGPLLIWGGSTSAGISTIQLARASGIRTILVTASPKHHKLLEHLGATKCFDYAAPNVTSEIKSAIEAAGNGQIRYAIDAVGSQGERNSADRILECVGEDKGVKLVSVIMRPDPRFQLPWSLSLLPVTIQPLGGPVISIPADPARFKKVWRAMEWVVSHYGRDFSMPVVTVCTGSAEQILDELNKVAGQGKFGKMVIQHPLQ